MADEPTIKSDQASAGGPSMHDPASVRARSETPGMLSPEELDRRQEKLRTTRRTGGPDLAKTPSRRRKADRMADDVPPTETEEPPEE